MGVTGLWTVVHPCARPVKIETLNKKRLAVDASIWIYQFLKAVRDKEGNALRNSHVVGFFRRICKLLFFGIKPVFVFDGGAPTLKRQTINNRKRRREGRRDDAVKTAGKLLALQMQRLAEEEEQKRKDEATSVRSRNADVEEEPIPVNLVYAEEAHMTTQERQQNRKFKKKDAYHLPELDRSMAEMGQPDDPRIMSVEELQMYAEQFNSGEDINVYDFSKIDFDSPFFTSLPASDRYNILNAARLRSRLRMGHSKEQLDAMFPDRMAFSRFQIERVAERNNLTQRLMHINSLDGDLDYGGVSRVAGEKGREYVLIKNDGVEGGWALGVVTNKDEGKIHKPIDLDKPVEVEAEDSSDDEFEDVPIVGINRLPKAPPVDPAAADILARDQERRRALYRSRKTNGIRKRKKFADKDPESLFVADESEVEEWEDVGDYGAQESRNTQDGAGDEDEDLQRAIAMSLQPDKESEAEEEDEFEEVFQQARAEEARPFAKGSGMSIAHMANSRSNKIIPTTLLAEDSDDDEIDLQAALAESRRTRHKPRSPVPFTRPGPSNRPVPTPPSVAMKASGFDGPLPFEKLDLGSSLLGKKKMEKLVDDAAGGFEREPQELKKKAAAPMPAWFSTSLEESLSAQREREEAEREREERERLEREALNDGFIFDEPLEHRKRNAREVIDLEAPEKHIQRSVIEIESSDEEKGSDAEMQDVTMDEPSNHMPTIPIQSASPPNTARSAAPELAQPSMDDVAQRAGADPPLLDENPVATSNNVVRDSEPIDSREKPVESDDEPLEWSESDREDKPQGERLHVATIEPAGGSKPPVMNEEMADASDEDEFEDVIVPAVQTIVSPPVPTSLPFPDAVTTGDTDIPEATYKTPDRRADVPPMDTGVTQAEIQLEEEEAYQDQYSDPEDEELFRQLAQEQEEHARFASTLNNRSMNQNIADYEKELKQLRNQQAKDRRDADEVTQTMVSECQQLLALFGLPYITAPMEAEAQCAELVHLGLVDGIVTDDSDIFLFGGTRVYKNMFNSAKFVECYLTSDLESEFGLTRQRLISIAQLLGSDYTEGLPGIGPVTAIEILSEFDNLTAFKDWLNAVQLGQRSKQDDASNAFKKKFRKNATKVFVPTTFPDLRVEEAYHHPEVDSDPSAFVWGVPDLSALRSFLMATIGWTPDRTDEVLVPVIKDMNRRQNEGTQANITAFFDGGVGAGAFAPRRRMEGGSKRLETALHRIGQKARGNIDAAIEDDQTMEGEAPAAARAKSKPTDSKRRIKAPASHSKPSAAAHDPEVGDDDFYDAAPRKKIRKVTKMTKTRSKTLSNEDDNQST
ncbi:PIN domain-like protein [Venturia nashicola]|uniref:PIN domain-like protein n=1 Tax=Venturia nashicola TaxID=86259 RepID=A0A4Z1PIR4_9PEZI|nr:PIN domain-like protein [Venturia nashicola]TLD35923.1 PIN domain-like protein [Venturia nashicola]